MDLDPKGEPNMAGQTAPIGDPDVIAETELDLRAEDLLRGAGTRLGIPTDEMDRLGDDFAPLARSLIRFAVAFKLGDLDWIADSALKYTGE